MLMNLASLNWDEEVCAKIGIPVGSLPEIRSNSEELGRVQTGALKGVPIMATIGDQHAALLGQGCLQKADVKSTFGTGAFIVMNTGPAIVPSTHGLLTTLGFKLGKDATTVYALEGAVAIAGRGIQWLRDSLKIIKSAPAINELAASVPDSGGVIFVPAFSGLLAPHWEPDARAAVLGMSLHTTDAHIARALLDGVAFQCTDVMQSMCLDAGVEQLSNLKVDGGLTASDLAMQIQANLMGQPLFRARMSEATALGAAFAAGLGVKFWEKPDDILSLSGGADIFTPNMTADDRTEALTNWKKAVSTVVTK